MFQQRLVELKHRRAAAAPLPVGSGPFTSSDHFRAAPSRMKPLAVQWDHHFSAESNSQFASELKIASRGGGPPSSRPRISLGTGRPATQYFPWNYLMMNTTTNDGSPEQSTTVNDMSCFKSEINYDLDIAMNYGFSAGAPQTLRWITEHVEMVHDPPYQDWGCCVSCGSTSGLEIALRLFCNRGDWILVEEHTYPGTISTAKSQGLNIAGVAIDGLGLCPDDLDQKLMNWDPTKGRKPYVLYVIPSGQNPTGTTQNLARREAIYRLAEKHDLYILEDDPYYFLNLGLYVPGRVSAPTSDEDVENYLHNLPKSYLSMDTSGRVMRIDSTSKILAPGLRFGWITASSQVIDKFIFHAEGSVLAPSGPSQVMVYKLLDEVWGHEGFFRWLMHLSDEYTHRRDVLLNACQDYLPPHICRWSIPASGMFLWIKISLGLHPFAGHDKALAHVEERIYNRGLEEGVLVSKGSWFAVDQRPGSYALFRMSFATASDQDMEQAVQLFATVVREEYSIN